MTLRDFIGGELSDVIEWLEDSPDAMVWRFARPQNEIKNGAQLIVRPGQVAVFVDQGTVAEACCLAEEDADGGAVGDRLGIQLAGRGALIRCPYGHRLFT